MLSLQIKAPRRKEPLQQPVATLQGPWFSQVMVPMFWELKAQTEGGNLGNQKIKEEDQGRVSWLPFGDRQKATVQYGPETGCLAPLSKSQNKFSPYIA